MTQSLKPTQLEVSATCLPTCLPVTPCCLVLDNSRHVTDPVTGSQSQSRVGIFHDTLFAKLVQSQHVGTDVFRCRLGQVMTLLMSPTRLVTRCRHVGMSVADMSYGGSSQHDTMPTFPTKDLHIVQTPNNISGTEEKSSPSKQGKQDCRIWYIKEHMTYP